MKFDSPFFDRIRVKPGEDRRVRTDLPVCDWPGCQGSASHRAPKGREREGEYWRFCLDHVREYNHSYNYFKGMSDLDVAKFQKDAITGHRPTWKMGIDGRRAALDPDAQVYPGYGAADPFNVFAEVGGTARQRPEPEREARTVRNAERKALDAMGLEGSAKAPEIKARFKVLVKRHHPDANGGDRSCEDKLREIIQAYNYLRSVGFC